MMQKVKMEISKLIPELEDKMRKNTLSDFEDVLDKYDIILIVQCKHIGNTSK